MPVVFRFNGIRFHFFSNEGDPREPLHIHAQRAECLAKVWLRPASPSPKIMAFRPANYA